MQHQLRVQLSSLLFMKLTQNGLRSYSLYAVLYLVIAALDTVNHILRPSVGAKGVNRRKKEKQEKEKKEKQEKEKQEKEISILAKEFVPYQLMYKISFSFMTFFMFLMQVPSIACV